MILDLFPYDSRCKNPMRNSKFVVSRFKKLDNLDKVDNEIDQGLIYLKTYHKDIKLKIY